MTFNKRFGADQGAIDHIFVEQKARASLRPVACDVIFRSVEPDGVWASDHFGVVAKLAVGK